MKLPKIYRYFTDGQIFTIDEAREKLQSTGNTLRKRLSELAARDYILPIRQGLYRVCPLGTSPESLQSSPFAIASKVTPYCYIGYKTALQFHANQVPSQGETIYVVSPSKFNAFEFEGRSYFWCQSSENYGIEQRFISDPFTQFEILVTDVEKTIVDCLRRPAHAPALPEFLQLAQNLQVMPDPAKLLDYARRAEVSALFNRMGLFFSLLNSRWAMDPAFMEMVHRSMSRKVTDWPLYEGHLAAELAEQLSPLREKWRVHIVDEPRSA